MRIYKSILAIGVILLLSSCSSISVNYDYDVEAEFSKYKTYKWIEKKSSQDGIKNPLARKRLRTSVDNVLNSKGFEKKEKGKADFLVIIHTGIQDRMDVTHWGYHYGPWYGPRTTVSRYKEGTLFIDIVDTAEKELVWRGSGTSIMKSYYTPEERAEAVEEVVIKILENFPPGKK